MVFLEERKYYIFLFMGILMYTALFTMLQILKYKSFFEFSWEWLAKQNNIVWNTAHGNFFYSSLRDSAFLGHFEPIYFLIAIPYFFYPNIHTLFFLWSFIVALGSMPIFLVAKKLFNNLNIALMFSFAYLLFNPLHNLSIATIRTDLLAITFLLFTFYFYYVKRIGSFLIFAILSLMCKEDVAFIIFMFAIFSIINRRRTIWILTPIFLGLFWFLISLAFLTKVGNLDYFREHLSVDFIEGGNIFGIIKFIFKSPLAFIKKTFMGENFTAILRFFNPPIMYIALFSPGVMSLGLPVIVHILLAANDKYLDGSSIHHIAYFLPFIFLATLFSFKKIFIFLQNLVSSQSKKRPLKAFSVYLFFILIILSNFGKNSLIRPGYRGDYPVEDKRFLIIDNIFGPKLYTMDEVDKVAWKFIRLIPEGASVSASGDLLPALSSRSKIYEFGTVSEIHDMSGHENDVDYILLRKKSIYHGYDFNEARNDISFKKIYQILDKDSHKVIKEDNNFILLEREIKN